jgi:hypothetical protein
VRHPAAAGFDGVVEEPLSAGDLRPLLPLEPEETTAVGAQPQGSLVVLVDRLDR